MSKPFKGWTPKREKTMGEAARRKKSDPTWGTPRSDTQNTSEGVGGDPLTPDPKKEQKLLSGRTWQQVKNTFGKIVVQDTAPWRLTKPKRGNTTRASKREE